MSLTPDAIWAALPSTTRGQPTQLSCDPKGERIAYASNKSIFLRSIDHPEFSKQYTAHTANTTVARWSPSGYYIASGDATGTVRVWDAVGDGATKGEYNIISGRINDISWDGDSQRIIAVGDGKERFGHCITADSGNSVGEISGQASQINSVSIRQQRPLRAATASDDTTVAFFTGVPFKFSTSLRGCHQKFVYGTAFSPDGNTFVSVGSDRRIWIYDGKSGEVKKQIGEGEHTGSIFAVSWAKDSKRFVTASADQTVKIWDPESGECVQSWRMGGEGVHIPSQQVGVVWAREGLIISVDLEGNLNYFDPGSSKSEPVNVVRGHQGSITAGALSRNTLVTGSYEGRIRSWDIGTGTASLIDGQSHSTYVAGISTPPGSNAKGQMQSIGWDDTLRSIDLSTGTGVFTGSCKRTSAQPKGVATTSSGTCIVLTAEGIELFTPGSDKATKQTLPQGTGTCIASSCTDMIAVGISNPNAIQISSLASDGKSLIHQKTVTDASITSTPSTLAFSPAGMKLAVGLSGGRICVFNTTDHSLITSRWSAHTARVTGIAWDVGEHYAVSGSLDTNVYLWSLREPGKRVKVGNVHKDGVNGVAWALDGKGGKVLSWGADGVVRTFGVALT